MEALAERPRGRRTQAERRAETRARLLDATLDCVVEWGYGGATTTMVSERAGVSRGAQLHHFPNRAALVAAALEHLFERMRLEYQSAFAELGTASPAAAVDLLWSMFEQPHFAAVLELDIAARTDPELRRLLLDVSERHQQHVFRLAHRYFPALAESGRLDDLLQVILDAMAGMAMTNFVMGRLPERERRLATLRGLAERALDAKES